MDPFFLQNPEEAAGTLSSHIPFFFSIARYAMEVLLDGGKMAYDGGQYWKGGDDGFAIRKNSEGTTPGQTKNQELTIFAEQSSRREDSFGSLPTVELTSTSTFAFSSCTL